MDVTVATLAVPRIPLAPPLHPPTSKLENRVTRVQRERFESQALYERTKGSYVVDAALMRQAKATCAILHPLPRVDEIATDVDALPNAAYFRQMEHGLYARMALLDLVLGRPSMLDGLRAALGL